MPDANHISPNDEELSNEQLMSYLQGTLSDDELRAMEKQMENDAFVNEALQGLQQFGSGKKLDEYVKQLNGNLQQQIAAQKQKKERRKLKDMPWIVQAVVIILLLCLLAYFVVSFVYKHNKSVPAKTKTTSVTGNRNGVP